MTRNKYCDVCGTEQVRRWVRKRKPESSPKKKPLSSKKKKIISLSVFLIIGVVLPAILIWITQRPHYEGTLFLNSVNIVPVDQTTEQLEVVFIVWQSTVFVKTIELFSPTRAKYYGSFSISFVLEEYETRVVSFELDKFDPLFNEGFCMKITHKFKVQWITHLF